MDNPTRAEMIDLLTHLNSYARISGGLLITPSGVVPASKARQAAEELRAELSALDDAGLRERYDQFLQAQRKRAEEAEAKHIFNQPVGRADFDHWAKMEYWTVDEGIALLLGRSPTVLTWDKVYHINSPVVRQFQSIREMAERAVSWKTLQTGNRPGAFILWAKRFEHPVPEELEQKVQKFGHFMGDWYTNFKQLEKMHSDFKEHHNSVVEGKDRLIARWQKQFEDQQEASNKNHNTAIGLLRDRDAKLAELKQEIERRDTEQKAIPKDKPLGTRETDTLRKLVIGLAIEGYGYDPNAARSEIPAQIASDFQLRGLDITDDTVRKHLKESAKLLPPEERLSPKR